MLCRVVHTSDCHVIDPALSDQVVIVLDSYSFRSGRQAGLLPQPPGSLFCRCHLRDGRGPGAMVRNRIIGSAKSKPAIYHRPPPPARATQLRHGVQARTLHPVDESRARICRQYAENWERLLRPVLDDLLSGRTVLMHCLSAKNRSPAFSSQQTQPANGPSGGRFGSLLCAGHPNCHPAGRFDRPRCAGRLPRPIPGCVCLPGQGIIVRTGGLQRRWPSPKRPIPHISDLPRTCCFFCPH